MWTMPPNMDMWNTFMALETLDVSFNRIVDIPNVCQRARCCGVLLANLSPRFQSIWHMPALKTFILDHNLLTHLPETMCHLKSLRTFSAVANQISNIPESIGCALSAAYTQQKRALLTYLTSQAFDPVETPSHGIQPGHLVSKDSVCDDP